jgi:leader peptidase (prepilin peptidase)/N-methyltransferase
VELLFIFLIGLAVGSFLNVLIYRIPLQKNIAYPASHCPTCGHKLKWRHNIPLFSWIFLNKKCAFCKQEISPVYPLVEFICGLLFVVLYLKLGLSFNLLGATLAFSMLLALSVIDFKYFAIPDSLNLAAIGFALMQLGFIGAFYDALMLAGGFALLRFLLSYLIKKEAMGEGDIMIGATMGALLGLPNALFAIFLSALLALFPSIIAKDNKVPFVPFLALATLIVYLFDDFFIRLGAMIYA